MTNNKSIIDEIEKEEFDNFMWNIVFKHLTPETQSFIKLRFRASLSHIISETLDRVELEIGNHRTDIENPTNNVFTPNYKRFSELMAHLRGYNQAISDLSLIKSNIKKKLE